MLRDAASTELPEAAVAALAERTEGWAAGLQLAGLSLRGHQDVAGFVAAFTGTHRYVLDYLAEEVLEHQGEQMQEFLLETSVLDGCRGSCATRSPASQPGSARAGRGGQLVPGAAGRGACLVALPPPVRRPAPSPPAARAARTGGAAARQRRRLVETRGLADDVRHAMAAGDMTRAARLIERHFDEVFFLRGEGATIGRWLSALPDELVRSRSRLLLAQALMAGTSGHVEAVEPLLDAAERACPGHGQGAV